MRRPIIIVDGWKRTAADNAPMKCYTIYDHPLDFPDHFVVRAWLIVHGMSEPQATEEHYLCDTLNEARERVPDGLVCFQRNDDDDPKVVETWV
jgi:hypothetical protein